MKKKKKFFENAKKEPPRFKTRAMRLKTFVPKDDEENTESLNAGYEAKTPPYATYEVNKR